MNTDQNNPTAEQEGARRPQQQQGTPSQQQQPGQQNQQGGPDGRERIDTDGDGRTRDPNDTSPTDNGGRPSDDMER